VYAWDIDKAFRAYLEGLSLETVRSVAAFTTAGGMNKTGTITSIVQARGIPVREEMLPVKVMLRNHAALGGKGDFTLSDKEIGKITGFVRKLVD